jgi:hypothetical protein
MHAVGALASRDSEFVDFFSIDGIENEHPLLPHAENVPMILLYSPRRKEAELYGGPFDPHALQGWITMILGLEGLGNVKPVQESRSESVGSKGKVTHC